MSRYIDVDKLVKDVLASWDKDNHKTLEASRVHRQEHRHLMSIIEKQPTADVVAVVRCGECKRWKADGGYGLDLDGTKRLYGKCAITNMAIKEKCFCNFGARKDTEDNK